VIQTKTTKKATVRALIGWALILSGGLLMLFGWGAVGRVLVISCFLGLMGVWTLPQSQPPPIK
jgi:hypothetical protein